MRCYYRCILFLFPSKEAIFCTIVDPVINELLQLTKKLVSLEKSDPATALENDRLIMEFELKHKKELLILMEKADGSCRAHIRSQLVNIRFQSNLYLLKGNFTMEQTFMYNTLLSSYADGGFYTLIKQYKEIL